MLPLQLSASAVRDFRQCAFRYALAYITPNDPRERPQEALLAFGQIVHAVLAEFIRQGGWEVLDQDDLATLLDAHWRDEVYPDPRVADDHHRHALCLLERFFEARYPHNVEQELGVERPHSWRGYHRGIMASGRIDRACLLTDGTLELLDYKTGRCPTDGAPLADDPQALFYRSLGGEAYRRFAPTRVLITFYYLTSETPRSIEFERAAFELGWQRIDDVAKAIRVAITQVMNGSPSHEAFPPRRGPHCHYCPMRRICDRALDGFNAVESGAA